MKRGAMKSLLGAAALLPLLSACAGMSDTQQRALTGTGIGAAGGAVLGAIGGNAALGAVAGAGAGLVGGLLVDQSKKQQQSAFDQGYAAGRASPSR